MAKDNNPLGGSFMVSRTGKSTSHLYKAFETKINKVESKVKASMGQGSHNPTKLENISENSEDDEKKEQENTSTKNQILQQQMEKIKNDSVMLTEKQKIKRELQL